MATSPSYDPSTPSVADYAKKAGKALLGPKLSSMASATYHVFKGDAKPEDSGPDTGEGAASKMLRKASPGYDKLLKATGK